MNADSHPAKAAANSCWNGASTKLSRPRPAMTGPHPGLRRVPNSDAAMAAHAFSRVIDEAGGADRGRHHAGCAAKTVLSGPRCCGDPSQQTIAGRRAAALQAPERLPDRRVGGCPHHPKQAVNVGCRGVAEMVLIDPGSAARIPAVGRRGRGLAQQLPNADRGVEASAPAGLLAAAAAGGTDGRVEEEAPRNGPVQGWRGPAAGRADRRRSGWRKTLADRDPVDRPVGRALRSLRDARSAAVRSRPGGTPARPASGCRCASPASNGWCRPGEKPRRRRWGLIERQTANRAHHAAASTPGGRRKAQRRNLDPDPPGHIEDALAGGEWVGSPVQVDLRG
jgi:hypothetical protein